jgi:serine/threonine protein kinase
MGEIFGDRFRIIRSLGKGGMGEVYLADDSRLGRQVALKCIGAAALGDDGSRARFRREAQAASRLDHPNICKIYGIDEADEKEFIIMQFVDGVTLDQLLRMKPLSVGKIIGIALQITEGMIAAQAQDIVHHDLKPGNIMIDKNGVVRILDFGLAEFRPRKTADRKTRRPEPGLSAKDMVMGTASYMSPEQLAGQDYDGRSDIFSFGVVLFEMIENINPFSTPDNIVTFYNIRHREIQFSRNIPETLRAIVKKSLRKDREERYGDFAEIRRDLLALPALMD